MTPNKSQQAQEYAEKILNENSAFELDYFGLPQAWLDGYTACEQSKEDSEATFIQRWVARDRDDNTLWMYAEKPLRDGNVMWYGKEPIALPTDFFPSLTWSDEPIECEFLIKPKKR